MWLFFAFLAPIFFGVANIFDNYLTNRHFKNPMTLAFYASVSSVILIPVIFIFYKPTLPPIETIPIFIILGIINISYLYPYYKGLQSDDTSTTVAFFGLGRIFIPIWAFFIVGEQLSLEKYAGILMIVIASILLSIKGNLRDIKFSKALFYILTAAFIISFEGVFLKYLFNNGVSVGTGVAGEMIASILFVFVFLIHKNTRSNILENFSTFKKNIPVFLAEEGATFAAFFAGSYALDLAPVSLVRSIGTFTPYFVLLYAKILSNKFPEFFNEEKNLNITVKKVVLFLIIALGVFLITR